MRYSATICFIAVVISGNAVAGNIYKCVDAAGNVSFSQTGCSNNMSGSQIGYSTPSQSRSPNGNDRFRNTEPSEQRAPSGYNAPSPMEQLRQIESDKEKKRMERRQWNLDKEKRVEKLNAERKENQSIGKETKIDKTKCEYYIAVARK